MHECKAIRIQQLECEFHQLTEFIQPNCGQMRPYGSFKPFIRPRHSNIPLQLPFLSHRVSAREKHVARFTAPLVKEKSRNVLHVNLDSNGVHQHCFRYHPR
jgi:hypothetical protein